VYGLLLLSSHSFGEEVTFMSKGQTKLLDSFVPVGMGFLYKIPKNTFDCEIERLEVSLAFNCCNFYLFKFKPSLTTG
jgi:hypothetical protein